MMSGNGHFFRGGSKSGSFETDDSLSPEEKDKMRKASRAAERRNSQQHSASPFSFRRASVSRVEDEASAAVVAAAEVAAVTAGDTDSDGDDGTPRRQGSRRGRRGRRSSAVLQTDVINLGHEDSMDDGVDREMVQGTRDREDPGVAML